MLLLSVEEKEEERAADQERPSPSGFRLPPGARGMPGMGGGPPGIGGMGGGLMSELKKKQRQSAMPSQVAAVVSSSDIELCCLDIY